MKTTLFLFTLLFVTINQGISQWYGSSLEGNTYRHGKVGIGVSSPTFLFEVEGDLALGKFKRLNNSWTDSPGILFVSGRGSSSSPADINAGDRLGKLQFRGIVSGTEKNYGYFSFIAADKQQNGFFSFQNSNYDDLLIIKSNGEVGIGTPLASNPNNYKLAVNGTIGAKMVKVEMNSGAWSDFVFNDNYKLKSLKEVEDYINEKNHLPDIPTAKEVEDKGVNLGEMDAKLLQKIEELTLYLIEQNKRIEELENRLLKNGIK